MERTRRRRFLIAAGALAASPFARAQSRLHRLALLYPNPVVTGSGDSRVYMAAWMKELGWIAGENLQIEHYSGDGREDRLPALAEEIVRRGADVIWVAGPEAALAAARVTQTIPIAFYGVGRPVEQELVESFPKPGRNVTGVASLAGLEWGKALEALRAIVPEARRLSWIRVQTVMRTVSGGEVRVTDVAIDPHAANLGFELTRHGVSAPEDLDGAFDAIRKAQPDALVSDFTAMTYRERHRIVDFATFHRLPSVFGALPYVQAGGLLSYGASRTWMAKHSFTFVDRILRGARPQELPVEVPTRFELFINLRTAKALGVTVPQWLLLQADKVIE